MERYRHISVPTVEDTGAAAYVPASPSTWLVLEGSAYALWGMLEQPKTLDELVQAAAGLYEGDPIQIRDDIGRTVQDWVAKGIVAVVG